MGNSPSTTAARKKDVLADTTATYLAKIDAEALPLAFAQEASLKDSTGGPYTPLQKNLHHIISKYLTSQRESRESEAQLVLEDAAKQESVKKYNTQLVELKIETPHNYDNNMDTLYEAVIKGAESLQIKFDPLSYTETNCDYLQIYHDKEKTRPFREKFTGPGSAWPTEPFTMPGDSAYFYFHSDGSTNYWGFRAEITGEIPRKKEEAPVKGKQQVNVEDLATRALILTNVAVLKHVSKLSPELHGDVLAIFADLLRSAKPGSLISVSNFVRMALSEFQTYLSASLLQDPHNVEAQRKGVVLMVALAIARGSQQDLLKLLPRLEGDGSIPALPYLLNWLQQGDELPCDLMTHEPGERAARNVPFSVGEAGIDRPEKVSVASDGTYLYVSTGTSLGKIGTGMNMTDMGRLYASDMEAKGISNLCCINGRLLGRREENLVWIDTRNLSVVASFKDTTDNAMLVSDGVSLHSVAVSGLTSGDAERLTRFSSRSTSTWNVDGTNIDAICVTVDRDIELLGLGMYGLNGNYTARFGVGRGTDRSCRDVADVANVTWNNTGNGQISDCMFDAPVALQAGVKYVITTLIRGPVIEYGEGGQTTMTASDSGIVFTFDNATGGPDNSTSIERGQIPVIIFRDVASVKPVAEGTYEGLIVNTHEITGDNPAEWKVAKAMQFPMEKWMRSSFNRPYCNGAQMVFPRMATFRKLDMRTGTFGPEVTRERIASSPDVGLDGCSRCFDVENNVTWVLCDKGKRLLAYPNPGLYRPSAQEGADAFATRNYKRNIDALAAADASSADISRRETTLAIYALLDRYVGPRELPRFPMTSEIGTWSEVGAFLWDLSAESFVLLFDNIRRLTDSVKAAPSEETLYQLLVLLRVFRSNLLELHNNGRSGSPYGIDHAIKNGLFALLEGLADLHVPVDSLADGVQLVRKLAANIVTTVGFDVLFPEPSDKLRYFAQLFQSQASLSYGKATIMNGIMLHNLGPVVDALAVPESGAETEQLLLSVLERVCSDAEATLALLPHTMADFGSYALPAKQNTFLALLRRAQAVVKKVEDQRMASLKTNYIEALMRKAVKIVARMLVVPDGWDAATVTQRENASDLCQDTFRYAFGDLLPGCLTDLANFVGERGMAEKWHDELLGLAVNLERFGTMWGAKTSAPPKRETVETVHPYNNNTDTVWDFDFSPATQIVATFDPRCATERNCDPITVITADGAQRQFSGPSGEWPRDPITLLGPKIQIKFHSDGSGTEWGCLLTLVGKVNVRWLESLTKIAFILANRAVSAMLSSSEPKAGLETISKCLTEPVFAHGQLLASAAEESAAAGTAAAEGTGIAAGIVEGMNALEDGAVKGGLAADILAVTRVVFLAHLHHTRALASSPAPGEKHSHAVTEAWKAALKTAQIMRNDVNGFLLEKYPDPKDQPKTLADMPADSEERKKCADFLNGFKSRALFLLSWVPATVPELQKHFSAAIQVETRREHSQSSLLGVAAGLMGAAVPAPAPAPVQSEGSSKSLNESSSKLRGKWKAAMHGVLQKSVNRWKHWRLVMAQGMKDAREAKNVPKDEHEDPHKRVNDAVSLFVQARDVTVDDVMKLIAENNENARLRLQGLQTVMRLAADMTPRCALALLTAVAQALRGEFREGTQGANPTLATELTHVFFLFIEQLATLLPNASVDTEVRSIILSLFNFRLLPADRDRITNSQIFSHLLSLLVSIRAGPVAQTGSPEDMLRRAAVTSFAALAVQCVQSDVDELPAAPRSRAAVLSDLLLGRLEHIVSRPGHALAQRDELQAIDVLGFLRVLISAVSDKDLKAKLASKQVVGVMLDMLVRSREAALQMATMQFLGDLLPPMGPGAVVKWTDNGTAHESPIEVFLMDMIAAAYSTPTRLAPSVGRLPDGFLDSCSAPASSSSSAPAAAPSEQELTDVALGRPATQNSTYDNHGADMAVSGNNDNYSETLSDNNLPCFMQVELDGPKRICKITGSSTSTDYIAGIVITIYLAGTEQWSSPRINSGSMEFTCDVPGITGDRVRVVRNPGNILGFRHFKVLSSPSSASSGPNVGGAAIMLLRSLQADSKWQPRVMSLVSSALHDPLQRVMAYYQAATAQEVAKPLSEDIWADMNAVAASLCMLGAVQPALMPGRRARIVSSGVEGFVIGDKGGILCFLPDGSAETRTVAYMPASELVDATSATENLRSAVKDYAVVKLLLTMPDMVLPPQLLVMYTQLKARAVLVTEALVSADPVLCEAVVASGDVPALLAGAVASGLYTQKEAEAFAALVPAVLQRLSAPAELDTTLKLKRGVASITYAGEVDHVLAGPEDKTSVEAPIWLDPAFKKDMVVTVVSSAYEDNSCDDKSYLQSRWLMPSAKNAPFEKVFCNNRGITAVEMYREGRLGLLAGFDTEHDADANGHLVQFINASPEGQVLLFAAVEDCTSSMNEEAKAALESLGSTLIRKVKFHDSWAMIAVKGRGVLAEAHKAQGSGVARISAVITAGEPESATVVCHPHPLLRHNHRQWRCDICSTGAGDEVASWHCTECNFDACDTCEERRRGPAGNEPVEVAAPSDGAAPTDGSAPTDTPAEGAPAPSGEPSGDTPAASEPEPAPAPAPVEAPVTDNAPQDAPDDHHSDYSGYSDKPPAEEKKEEPKKVDSLVAAIFNAFLHVHSYIKRSKSTGDYWLPEPPKATNAYSSPKEEVTIMTIALASGWGRDDLEFLEGPESPMEVVAAVAGWLERADRSQLTDPSQLDAAVTQLRSYNTDADVEVGGTTVDCHMSFHRLRECDVTSVPSEEELTTTCGECQTSLGTTRVMCAPCNYAVCDSCAASHKQKDGDGGSSNGDMLELSEETIADEAERIIGVDIINGVLHALTFMPTDKVSSGEFVPGEVVTSTNVSPMMVAQAIGCFLSVLSPEVVGDDLQDLGSTFRQAAKDGMGPLKQWLINKLQEFTERGCPELSHARDALICEARISPPGKLDGVLVTCHAHPMRLCDLSGIEQFSSGLISCDLCHENADHTRVYHCFCGYDMCTNCFPRFVMSAPAGESDGATAVAAAPVSAELSEQELAALKAALNKEEPDAEPAGRIAVVSLPRVVATQAEFASVVENAAKRAQELAAAGATGIILQGFATKELAQELAPAATAEMKLNVPVLLVTQELGFRIIEATVTGEIARRLQRARGGRSDNIVIALRASENDAMKAAAMLNAELPRLSLVLTGDSDLTAGKPTKQTSTHGEHASENATKNDTTIAHTSTTATEDAAWEVDLGEKAFISHIVLHNGGTKAEGASPHASWLRDVVVTVLLKGNGVYTSLAQNPANHLDGPQRLVVELPIGVSGDAVRVTRVPHAPVEGGAPGHHNALVLRKVEVFGNVPGKSKAVKPAKEAAATLNDRLAVEIFTASSSASAPLETVFRPGCAPVTASPARNQDVLIRFGEQSATEMAQITAIEHTAPAGHAQAALKTALLWAHSTRPEDEALIMYTSAYDGYTAERFASLRAGTGDSFPEPRPIAFLDFNAEGTTSVPLKGVIGKWFHLKFIGPHDAGASNVAIGHLSFLGNSPPVPEVDESAAAAQTSAEGTFTPTSVPEPHSGPTQTYQERYQTGGAPPMSGAADSARAKGASKVLRDLESSIVPDSLEYLAARIVATMGNVARQRIFSRILANWSPKRPLTVRALGEPEQLANFLMAYAREQSPMTYLLANAHQRDTHQLHAVMNTISLLVKGEGEDAVAAKAFGKSVADQCLEQLAKPESDAAAAAALAVLRGFVLENLETFGDRFGSIHATLLRSTWRADDVRRREVVLELLFVVLRQLFKASRGLDANATSAYNQLKELFLSQMSTTNPIDSTYVQALVDVVLMAERVRKAAAAAAKAKQDPKGKGPEEAAAETKDSKKKKSEQPPPTALVPLAETGTVEGLTVRSAEGINIVKSDIPLAPIKENPVVYYEVRVTDSNSSGFICIGLCSDSLTDRTMDLGLQAGATALHSDDGAIYRNNFKLNNTESYSSGDVIGVGAILTAGRVFFTKNGSALEPCVMDWPTTVPLSAAVSFKSEGFTMVVNYGQDTSNPWMFDPVAYYNNITSAPPASVSLTPAQQMWKNICEVDTLIDALVSGDCGLFPDDMLHEAYNTTSSNEIDIETMHPYDNNMDRDWEFVCPGATQLTITFDPQCRSEANYDTLAVATDPGLNNRIGTYSGTDWPISSPLTVPGDRVYLHFHSDGSSNDWGFKLHIRGPPSAPKAAVSIDAQRALFRKEKWGLAEDLKLAELINTVVQRKHISDPERIGACGDLEAGLKELFESDHMKEKAMALPLVAARLPILAVFNQRVRSILPYVDFSAATRRAGSLPDRLRRLAGLIYEATKSRFLRGIIDRTADSDNMDDITINRMRAMNSKNPSDTVFAQICDMFKSADKTKRLRRNDRAYRVNFTGEGSVDAGGPYRESIATMAQELQTRPFILMQCPNGRLGVGMNQDTYIPIASATDATSVGYYQFLGKLMGIAMRTMGSFEVSFSSMVWKSILQQALTLDDLSAYDTTTVKAIDALRHVDTAGVTAETFGDLFFETFTTHLSDGVEVELCPGGRDRPLTFENRMEYCALAEERHLRESQAQLRAVREGLATIVPMVVLDGLFTWQELERAICGVPTLDLPLLKSKTCYGDGVSATDSVVTNLWTCLERMEPEEHALFLRFAWGRSRLPLTPEGFTNQFKIALLGREPADKFLPVAHTCFFTIDMPRYSTVDIMLAKLRYAIHNCVAIDADNDAVDRSGWTDTGSS